VLVGLAGTLWLRGFADQALRIAQKAIGEAASQDHPVPICVSLLFASTLSLWTGDLPPASDLVAQAIVRAGRYSLAPHRALGVALKGELAIARDEPEAGLELLRGALETLRGQQYNLLFNGALAEGPRKTGNSRRRFLRSMEPSRARRIAEWSLTCPNCFGSSRRFSRRDMTVNQP
jgi:hypothetical protein